MEEPSQGTPYALPNSWERARRRLELIERHRDPHTRRRLGALGAATGWRCLEVGAGAGSIARWLCRRVGPFGHVTATDIDVRLLGGLEEANLTVLRHDLTRDSLPDGSFDLVHVRWVLHHLPDPDRVVERLVAAARPGGWLLIEELDRFPVAASPCAAYVALLEACTRTIEAASGGSYEWARTMPPLLAALGLEDQGGELNVPVVFGGSPQAEFLQLSCLQVRDQVLSSGRMAEPVFDRALALLASPGFIGFSGATVAAWGRRPGVAATVSTPRRS